MLLSTADVKIKKVSGEGNIGVYSFDPIPQGFGNTLGNSLRRVLLTSLKGSAITQIKFDKAVHQYTTLDGVKEDLVEILLNLKQVNVKMHSDNPVVGKISKKGSGKVLVMNRSALYPANSEEKKVDLGLKGMLVVKELINEMLRDYGFNGAIMKFMRVAGRNPYRVGTMYLNLDTGEASKEISDKATMDMRILMLEQQNHPWMGF